MAKCTRIRCPLQHGYKVEECNHKDCQYRTEPITNADRIRAMNDKEFSCFLALVKNRKMGKTTVDDTSDFWLAWLKQPAEEMQ